MSRRTYTPGPYTRARQIARVLRARDLDDVEAVVDREQRKKSREVAVERNVLQHIAARRTDAAGDVVERAVREPSRGEVQREMLQPIDSRVESRPPSRDGEIDAAIHRREELANAPTAAPADTPES